MDEKFEIRKTLTGRIVLRARTPLYIGTALDHAMKKADQEQRAVSLRFGKTRFSIKPGSTFEKVYRDYEQAFANRQSRRRAFEK